MECWSVRGHYPTSLELLWVNFLDLGKFFNSQIYVICSLNLSYILIHTSLFNFFQLIRSADILLPEVKACLCSLLMVFLHVLYFLKISWTFLYNLIPVYTDKDQWLAVISIGCLLNNRDDAIAWRGPEKNGIYFLLTCLDLFKLVNQSWVSRH